MERCVILWDLESIPFFFQSIVKKYILNMGFNYHLDPRFIAVSKKNQHLFSKIKKKRGFEHLITEDTSKDGADRLLKTISKQFENRTVVLISNDLRFAKDIAKKRDLVLFYTNGDIPAKDMNFKTIHVYDNFNWDKN